MERPSVDAEGDSPGGDSLDARVAIGAVLSCHDTPAHVVSSWNSVKGVRDEQRSSPRRCTSAR